jgi:Fe-S-cluster-containing dehydrogenase component
MKVPRRSFLRAAAAVGAAALAPAPVRAGSRRELYPERKGVLVDTTVCVGCRRCEWACKREHGIETPPVEAYDDASVFERPRRPDTGALTVVNRIGLNGDSKTVKAQCMHCEHPACLSACIVGAFSKEPNGAVVWDTDKCIGCRYCMIACPFQVPAFEYDKALKPDIKKCDFCAARQTAGKLPACVDVCPVEALTYGRREDLLRVAHDRIRRSPDRYAERVFGEREVGGTAWLYLAPRESEDLGFPKLGTEPAPGVVETIQHGLFAYFVPPVSLYALLGIMMRVMKREDDGEEL